MPKLTTYAFLMILLGSLSLYGQKNKKEKQTFIEMNVATQKQHSNSEKTYCTIGLNPLMPYNYNIPGRIIYSYNPDSTLADRTEQLWDTLNSLWNNTERSTYSYDNGQNVIEDISFVWDTLSNVWDSSVRETFVYDLNDQLIQNTAQFMDSQTWTNWLKHSFTYDANGDRTIDHLHRWDSNAGLWVNESRDSAIFDVNGNKTNMFTYEWNQAWNYASKTSYSYDQNNKILQKTTYSPLGDPWEKTTYTYDVNGYPSGYTWFDWDSQNGGWKNYFWHSLMYDSTGLLLEGINHDWNEQTLSWDATYKYFYSGNGDCVSALSLTESLKEELVKPMLFPNPASSYFQIDHNASLELYDVTGRVVLILKDTKKGEAIDVSALAKGIYCVKVNNGRSTHVHKLILE